MDYSIDKNLLQGLRDNEDAAFKYLYQRGRCNLVPRTCRIEI